MGETQRELGSSLADAKCPHHDTWQHVDIADSLAMPVGTLLTDASGQYCPACDYRPEFHVIALQSIDGAMPVRSRRPIRARWRPSLA